MDGHTGVIEDIKLLWKDLADILNINLHIIDLSMSFYCRRFDTCGDKYLNVINSNNHLTLCPNPMKTRKEFYEYYRKQDWFRKIDAFICSVPTSTCELYMPFNKTMIIIVAMFWRSWHGLDMWKNEMSAIGEKRKNIIVSNNRQDQEEIIRDGIMSEVDLVPSMTEYTKAKYDSTAIPPFCNIILVDRHFNPMNRTVLIAALNTIKCKLVYFPEFAKSNGSFSYVTIARHVTAAVIVPWGPTLMTAYEFYGMEIPLFFASSDFLLKRYRKTWGYQMDWLQWSAVQFFDSEKDLANKIAHSNFSMISKQMHDLT